MLNKGVIKEIGQRFEQVSNQMANRVLKQFESLNGHEEDISAGLKTQFTLNLMDDIKAKLDNKKINNVEFNVQIFKKNTESSTGSDLGFILKFINDGIEIRKGLLIQSKVCVRMESDGVSYYYCAPRGTSANSNVLNQADSMLSFSSDSFFFLYTPRGIKIIPSLAVKLNGIRGIDTRNFYMKSLRFFMRDYFKCFIGDHKIGGLMDAENYLLDLHSKDMLDNLIKIEAKASK